MKIEVHLILGVCHEEVRARIGRDSALSKSIDVNEIRVPVDSESRDFERIVAITRDLNAGGLVWTPWVEYSAVEARSCGHFEIWPRKSITDGSYREKNADQYMSSELVETLPGIFVKMLRDIRVASMEKISGAVVGNLGQSFMELIAGNQAIDAFAACGLRGMSLGPVLCGRAEEPHPDFHHLVADNFAPQRATRDVSIRGDENIHDGPGSLRRLGSLSYEPEAFPLDTDFWRTAEGWYGGQPLWIVSQRVAACFKAANLKGLSFRPVLAVGSELHRNYLEKWDRLLELMAGNPRNRLW